MPLMDKPNIEQHRYLVTGGSGFIGTNLVEAFRSEGHAVLNADVRPPMHPLHQKLWVSADLVNVDSLNTVFRDFSPTHVFHLGARTDLLGKSLSDYAANTDGVSNIVRAARTCPSVRRVIYCSSRLVCKIGYQPNSATDYCPTTAYGESKVQGEKIVRDAALSEHEWTIVRPTSLWGPWFGIPYRTFFDLVKKGRYVHPSGKIIRKSFGYVGNAVFQLRSIMHAAPRDVNGGLFYVGDYDPIEVRGFAEEIARAFGAPSIRQVPTVILSIAAVAGDLLQRIGYRNPPLTTFRLENLMTEMVHDFVDLPRITGPLPYSVSSGVRDTVEWMRSYG